MAISTRPYDHKHVSLLNKHVWRFPMPREEAGLTSTEKEVTVLRMSLCQAKDGLKGQKAASPGQRPGCRLQATFSPCKGKSSMIQMLMPLQGDITLNVPIPRAMPWAKS